MPKPRVWLPRTVVNESANSQFGLSDPLKEFTGPPPLEKPPVPKPTCGHVSCKGANLVKTPVRPISPANEEGGAAEPCGASARRRPKRKLFTLVAPMLMV